MEKDQYAVNADPESPQLPSYVNDRKGSVLGEAADLYGNVQVAEQVSDVNCANHAQKV